MITIWVPKRLVEIDLYNVAAQSPAALAEMSEKSYRQRVAYAAQKIRDSRAKIVMLTGPSASGKTTSAHKVAEALEASGTPSSINYNKNEKKVKFVIPSFGISFVFLMYG